MSPLRPTGWTTTVPLVDEWSAEYLHTEPRMSRAQMNEAATMLGHLHELVGEQAAEVMAFLVVILHRRDGASMALLRWLRSLDESARS